MQAVGFRQYGNVDVLESMELPRPDLAPDGLLVRVAAAGVNPADSVMRTGQLKWVARISFPFVPGLDAAGVVEQVGEQVTRFRPGDRVYAMLPNTKMGAYAEYVMIRESAVARVPAGVPLSDAAAFPCAALTALQALRDTISLQPGQRVLINGASGGVGSFAVQIAKAMGAHVTAVASTRNLDLLRDLGADAVIDYTRMPVPESGQTFDAVFDAVGTLQASEVLKVLPRGGAGATVNPVRGNPLAGLRARLGGRRWASLFVKPSGSDLEHLNVWWESGQVKPVIEHCYPLAAAAEATRHSESKRTRGKLVLIVDPALAGR